MIGVLSAKAAVAIRPSMFMTMTYRGFSCKLADMLVIKGNRIPLCAGEGDTILEIQRDITIQLRAEEALRQAEKMAAMGRAAGIIAHEINNPLEAITNAFYLLRNHPSLDAEARGYAALAEQELVRASRITSQTLSFYRESREPVLVELQTLLDDICDLKLRSLHNNEITVERKYLSAAAVRGFPGELRQVFLNLMENAIYAMPSGGVLQLHVRATVDWPTQRHGIAVAMGDTGSGILPKDAKRLFEPFFTTKAERGTGLGLWISKGIVQKYEGTLKFRSLHGRSGSCTCFRVFLPDSTECARQPES